MWRSALGGAPRLALALTVWAGASRAQDAADRAYAARHYAMAAALWHTRAASGDPHAAYSLSLLYDLGRGVPRSQAQALHWCHVAANAGIADAEFNMGAMLEDGPGAAPDPAAAALWFARAAVHGVARAAYNLGQLYATGQGVPRNPSLAAQWFAAAAPALPAARQMAARYDRRAATGPAGTALLPAQPQAPPAGAVPPVLVWTGPAEPVPVRYFVSVVTLDGPHREVAGFFTDRSAAALHLPATSGAYAWRVFTVSTYAHRYSASPWVQL